MIGNQPEVLRFTMKRRKSTCSGIMGTFASDSLLKKLNELELQNSRCEMLLGYTLPRWKIPEWVDEKRLKPMRDDFEKLSKLEAVLRIRRRSNINFQNSLRYFSAN